MVTAKTVSYTHLDVYKRQLLDTGGQYVDGTTDTTRTYALGELTDEERRYYTYVLKANIGIARTVFMAVSYTHLQYVRRHGADPEKAWKRRSCHDHHPAS